MIVVVYIAVKDNPLLVSHATHFVDTYKQFPAGVDHRLIVVCNGGKLPPKMEAIFAPIKPQFLPRENDGGWDISAYIDVAHRFDSDLQVCFGESVYFHRAGWLERLSESRKFFGWGMHGCLSSYSVRPHLNTTAFAVTPEDLRAYPFPKSKAERYEFEHGENALWRRITRLRGEARLVTWDGSYDIDDWRTPKDILFRGDQSNCLVHCNHTDRFAAASPAVKERWRQGADLILA
jgi:hypothetical protein